MPVIVVYEMNKPPRTVFGEGPEIRVGRDTDRNKVVLAGSTVSREHAAFRQDARGAWSVACVSETNPIVVNGAHTKSNALVTDGSEVMIGSEYLLVFAENPQSAEKYLGRQGRFAKCVCPKCRWSGMVSTLRESPVCPKCGCAELTGRDGGQAGAAFLWSTPSESTQAVDMSTVQGQLEKLRAAKRSRIDRTDGKDPAAARRDLAEGVSVVIGKKPDCALKLLGFAWGDGVTIAWEHNRWVARSRMVFPAMKVNGSKASFAALTNGDVLQVGSNTFRFVTE